MKNINDVAGTDTVTFIPDLPLGKHKSELPIVPIRDTDTEEENIEEVKSEKLSVEQEPYSECLTQKDEVASHDGKTILPDMAPIEMSDGESKPTSVHKEKLPMNTTLPDASFRKIYQGAIKNIEMEYVEGTLAYVREHHPSLHKKIKNAENDAEAIRQAGDTNRLVAFKDLLDEWVAFTVEGIGLCVVHRQQVNNKKHSNSKMKNIFDSHMKPSTFPAREKIFTATAKTPPTVDVSIKTIMPAHAVEKVQGIEAEALSLGWKREQLFNEDKEVGRLGLICFLEEHKNIGEITVQYIKINWMNVHGEERTHTYYNHDIDLTWLKHVGHKGNI